MHNIRNCQSKIYKMSKSDANKGIQKLVGIMADLRDPETGCPWDTKQNFDSIAPFTIEEAYEVADAIARNDIENLKEELGDLLFQVVYHAQMAKERGYFTFEDVVEAINVKMIRRHPHVFGDENAVNTADVSKIWARQKAREKEMKRKQTSKKGEKKSILDDIPTNLPALPRCQKISVKAAGIGFEWPEPSDVLDKIEEEIDEMRHAISRQDSTNMEEEIGDLFFTLTNLARKLDIDSETALRKANQKFMNRFTGVERMVDQCEKEWAELTIEEMETFWRRQKKAKTT